MDVSERAERWEWIVFDVDGVLIDVSGSYDVATLRTAEMFMEELGVDYELTLGLVRSLRSKGKFGDDYRVSEGLVLAGLADDPVRYLHDFPEGKGLEEMREEFGELLEMERVVEVFDGLYLGDAGDGAVEEADGLWRNEVPLIGPEPLEVLEDHFSVGYITGRSRKEAKLAELILSFPLNNLITRDDAPKKPDPESLETLADGKPGVYVGDTANDGALVANYNRFGRDFDFILVSDGGTSVNKLVREVLGVVNGD